MTMEEAVTTGRLGPVVHAVRHLATTSLGGFFGALALFVGDALRAGLLAAVALEPIFPANTGVWVRHGMPVSFGVRFPAPPDAALMAGAWIFVGALVIGLAVLVLTHLAARRWISWLRRARAGRPWIATT